MFFENMCRRVGDDGPRIGSMAYNWRGEACDPITIRKVQSKDIHNSDIYPWECSGYFRNLALEQGIWVDLPFFIYALYVANLLCSLRDR